MQAGFFERSEEERLLGKCCLGGRVAVTLLYVSMIRGCSGLIRLAIGTGSEFM